MLGYDDDFRPMSEETKAVFRVRMRAAILRLKRRQWLEERQAQRQAERMPRRARASRSTRARRASRTSTRQTADSDSPDPDPDPESTGPALGLHLIAVRRSEVTS